MTVLGYHLGEVFGHVRWVPVLELCHKTLGCQLAGGVGGQVTVL